MAQPTNPFDLLIDQVRQAVREEVRSALQQGAAPEGAKAEPEPEWMRAEDLAKKYKLPKSLFDEKARAGEIMRCRPGRHILINVADAERFLRSYAAGGGNGKDH